MPEAYFPPMEENEASNRKGMGPRLLQMAAEANRFYVGEGIAKEAPLAIPGLYLGQVAQDVAKLGYFHGPAPVRKLSQKLSALAFGEDEQFNDKTTSRPDWAQYKALHEGVKRGVSDRISDSMIDRIAPALAKTQGADVRSVREQLQQDRDTAHLQGEATLSERLMSMVEGMKDIYRPYHDVARARVDQASLKKAGLVAPRQPTRNGDIWNLTHPNESRKLLVEQLRHLNPGMKIPEPVQYNGRLAR